MHLVRQSSGFHNIPMPFWRSGISRKVSFEKRPACTEQAEQRVRCVTEGPQRCSIERLQDHPWSALSFRFCSLFSSIWALASAFCGIVQKRDQPMISCKPCRRWSWGARVSVENGIGHLKPERTQSSPDTWHDRLRFAVSTSCFGLQPPDRGRSIRYSVCCGIIMRLSRYHDGVC